MLTNRSDLKTLLYACAMTMLLVLQWQRETISAPGYALMLLLAMAVPIMAHNHAHVPMWRSRVANTLSDWWFSAFQGHPVFAFRPTHERNHHVHCNGAGDWNRTWRTADENTLSALLSHPLRSIPTLYPHVVRHLSELMAHHRRRFVLAIAQYAIVLGFVGVALAVDPGRALVLVIAPQAVSVFWLFVSNPLQHAHADERSEYQHSRNFVGLLNPLMFNIGYHTAHHRWPDLHWSELPAAHRRIEARIDDRLIERSLLWYCLRTFALGPWIASMRSMSMRSQSTQPQPRNAIHEPA